MNIKITPPTSVKYNLLLIVCSIIICFCFFEFTFRIIAPKELPGTTYGKPVIRNSDGLRDREFLIPKPDTVYRILVLGDSFTWGIGLTIEETIPKQLEQMLRKASKIGNAEVVNASIPSYNTIQELLLLREKGLKYQPDMILLVYNLNDIHYLPHLSEQKYDGKKPIPVVEIVPGEDITKYSEKKGFRGFLLKIENHSVFVKFLVPRVGSILRRMGLVKSVEFSWVEKIFQGYTDTNPGWLEAKRGITEIDQICRANNCAFILAIYPLLVDLDNYKGANAHRKILQFCSTLGVNAIDLFPLFKNTKPESHWINFMDSHPNANAHKLVTKTLLPVICNEIESSQIYRKLKK